MRIFAFLLLCFCFTLALNRKTGVALLILIAVGLYDIWLSVIGVPTISQFIGLLTPAPVGAIIAMTLVAVGHFLGRKPDEEKWQYLLWAILYCVIGHIFWS